MTLPLAAATPSDPGSSPGSRTRRALVGNRSLTNLPPATPMCFGFLPIELVIEIFLIVAGNGDDTARRRAPFTISAVSSRWRNTALSFGILWSYLSIPDPGEVSSPSLLADYVTLMLERSRTAHLHIRLPWSDSQASSSLFKPLPDSTRHILTLISDEAQRWERFEFYSPGSGLYSAALKALFLGKDMPHLSRMWIGDSALRSPMIAYPVPAIWTSYPRLRSARLNIEFLQFTRDAQLNSLVNLELSSPFMVEDLWPVLGMTPALERLVLSCHELPRVTRYANSETPSAQAQCALPRLHTLIFRTPVAPELFSLLALIVTAPRLQKLELPANMALYAGVVGPILTFLEANGSAITHLRLVENVPYRADHSEQYARFVAGRDEHIWDKLLSRTHGPRSIWLCPSLAHIQLRNFHLLPRGATGLLRLQQSRNIALLGLGAATSLQTAQLSIDWRSSPNLECKTYELFCAFHDVSIGRDLWEKITTD